MTEGRRVLILEARFYEDIADQLVAGAVAAGHRRRTYASVVLKVLGVRRRDVVLIRAAGFALLGLVTGVIAAALL